MRIKAILLSVTLCLLLVGCGKSEGFVSKKLTENLELEAELLTRELTSERSVEITISEDKSEAEITFKRGDNTYTGTLEGYANEADTGYVGVYSGDLSYVLDGEPTDYGIFVTADVVFTDSEIFAALTVENEIAFFGDFSENIGRISSANSNNR